MADRKTLSPLRGFSTDGRKSCQAVRPHEIPIFCEPLPCCWLPAAWRPESFCSTYVHQDENNSVPNIINHTSYEKGYMKERMLKLSFRILSFWTRMMLASKKPLGKVIPLLLLSRESYHSDKDKSYIAIHGKQRKTREQADEQEVLR